MPSPLEMMAALMEQKKVPPLVVVCASSSAGQDGLQGSQRNLEYDTVSGVYGDFVETELLPFVSKECGVALSSDPDKRAVLGYSSGGAAGFGLAWHHPDKWRRVLCFSGTFTNQQYPFNEACPSGAWDYHSGKCLVQGASPEDKAQRKGLRVGLYSMQYDFGWNCIQDPSF